MIKPLIIQRTWSEDEVRHLVIQSFSPRNPIEPLIHKLWRRSQIQSITASKEQMMILPHHKFRCTGVSQPDWHLWNCVPKQTFHLLPLSYFLRYFCSGLFIAFWDRVSYRQGYSWTIEPPASTSQFSGTLSQRWQHLEEKSVILGFISFLTPKVHPGPRTHRQTAYEPWSGTLEGYKGFAVPPANSWMVQHQCLEMNEQFLYVSEPAWSSTANSLITTSPYRASRVMILTKNKVLKIRIAEYLQRHTYAPALTYTHHT